MKNLKFTVMLIALVFFAVSCSDDSGTSNEPDTTKNYFPSTTGNYWIFNDFSLDIENQKESPNNPSIDSAAITGTELAFGKTLSKYDIFTLIDNNYEKQNEMQLIYENNSLYIRSNYMNSFFQFEELGGFELPFNINDTLLRIIDTKNAGEREVYSKDITDFTIPDTPLGDIKINGVMKIKSKRTAEESISVDGASVNAIKYTIPISFDGEISVSSPLPLTKDFGFNLNYHIWLAENIGIVKTHLESHTIEIPIVFQTYDYLGFITELIRYKVAK